MFSVHEALDCRLAAGDQVTEADIETAAIEGAVERLRLKLMTVCAILASLIPILSASGIGSDVMKPIAAPMAGGNDVNDSRPDSGSSLLRVDEGTGATPGNIATERTTFGHRVSL